VISSAAENLSDGVVTGAQQLTQYGALIRNQAKQLIELVEQILLFAATRESRRPYNLHPLKVSELIDAALGNTAGLITTAGITVEQDIAPNLPRVMGDFAALSHCLQNLITNAVKYGGDARWMRIHARLNEGAHESKVEICVEDRGLGIDSAELRRIFEPFYRSPSVVAAQVHGTGLGLPLARQIADAVGGELTVTSEPGRGSCFTLILAVAPETLTDASAETAVAVNPKFSKT
jgi:signal transduction histidine kinase